ncbi:hypothetical protein F4Y93_02435 [Candidatus Poribacteria bacterium]|nr:hypothetical protein [Candidatus Poribacteria bacterium]
MTDVVENMDTAKVPRQQPGLISIIFRCYRDNFGICWRIMLPFILLSFLFDIADSVTESLFGSEHFGLFWRFDTIRGLAVTDYPEIGPPPPNTDSGMTFSLNTFSIGFLWLAMCPLTLAIVKYKHGAEVTMRRIWVRTRAKIGTILRGFFFLYVLGLIGYFFFLVLTSAVIPIPDAPYGSSICLGLFLMTGVLVYFGVNWSLYNQNIIIADQTSAIEAMRDSSPLVRGVWGRFFGIYLLLLLFTMVFTSVILGLTLSIFSLVVPEFMAIRPILLSPEFFTLFLGGYVQIGFEEVPSFWTVGVMVMVNTLVHAFLAPIWAILTTHLYLERTGESGLVSE